MKNRVGKGLSVLLCLALLLTMLPFSAIEVYAASVSRIGSVLATSNYSEPDYGDNIVSPTFNVTTANVTVVADKSEWQRLNPVTNEWEKYDSSWGSVSNTNYTGKFRAGTFRYAAWVELTNSTDCSLKHNVTFTVNGDVWTAINALDEITTENYVQSNKSFRAVSEQFVLNDPVGTPVYFHGPQPISIGQNWGMLGITPIELGGYVGGGSGTYTFEKDTASSTADMWAVIDGDGTVSGTPTMKYPGGSLYYTCRSGSGEVNERITVPPAGNSPINVPIIGLEMNFVIPTPILGGNVGVAEEFRLEGTFAPFIKCPELENGWYKYNDRLDKWTPYTGSAFVEGQYVYIVAIRVSESFSSRFDFTSDSKVTINGESNWRYMDSYGSIRTLPYPYLAICEDNNVRNIMRMVSPNFYVTDDYNSLPEVQNVRLKKGDIFSWEAFSGAAQYRISIGEHEFTVAETSVDLRQKASTLGLMAGKAYPISLYAVDSENEQISKTYVRSNIFIGRTSNISIHIFGQTLNSSNRYLIVSGNTISSANTGTLGSDGCVAYFDAASGVLNLQNSNFDYDDEIRLETANGLAGDLIINLHGSNKIRSATAEATRHAIVNNTGGDITITSDSGGTLYIEARADAWTTKENGGYRAVGIIAGDNKNTGAVEISGNASVEILANHTSDTTYHLDRYRSGAAGIQATTGITVKDNSSLVVDAVSLCTNTGGNSVGLINGGGENQTIASDIVIDTTGRVESDVTGGPAWGMAVENYNGDNRVKNVWGMTLWVKTMQTYYKRGAYPEFTYPEEDYVLELSIVSGKYKTVIKQKAFTISPTFTGENLAVGQWGSVDDWQIDVKIDTNEFADDLTGQAWITNLPHDLTQSISRTGERTATITVSGTAKKPTQYATKLQFAFPSNAFAEPIPECIAQSNITYYISAEGNAIRLKAGEDRSENGYTWATDSQNRCTLMLSSYKGKAIEIEARKSDGTDCSVTVKFGFTNYIDVYTGIENLNTSGISISNATDVVFERKATGASIHIDGSSYKFRGISTEAPVHIKSGTINIYNEFSDDSSLDSIGINTLSHPLTIDENAVVNIHMESNHPQSNGRDWFGIRCGQLNVKGSLNVEVTGARVSMYGIGIYPSETFADEAAIVFGGNKTVNISAPEQYLAIGKIKVGTSTDEVEPLNPSRLAFTHNSENNWMFQDCAYDVDVSRPASIANLKHYSYGEKITLIKEFGERGNLNNFKYYFIGTPCKEHTGWSDDYECNVCYWRMVIDEQPAQMMPVAPAAGAKAKVEWSLQPLYTENMFKDLPDAEYQIYKNDNTWSEWLQLNTLPSNTGGNVRAEFTGGTELTFTQTVKKAENYWIRLRVHRPFTNETSLSYETEKFNVSFGTKVAFDAIGVPFPIEGSSYSSDISGIDCGTGYSISEIRYYDLGTNTWLSDTAIASAEHQVRVVLTPVLSQNYSLTECWYL